MLSSIDPSVIEFCSLICCMDHHYIILCSACIMYPKACVVSAHLCFRPRVANDTTSLFQTIRVVSYKGGQYVDSDYMNV